MTDAILKDGIYPKMNEETYHAIPRLSNSHMKNMLQSPAEFWANSWKNPKPADADEKEQEKFVYGRAAHMSLFQPESFTDYFSTKFDGGECDLKTHTDIKEKLETMGEPKTQAGEGVLDAAKRLRDRGYKGRIFHLEKEAWEKEHGDKTLLSPKWWGDITSMSEMILASAIGEKITGGLPEITILWTDPAYGIPMKARLDYLTPTHFLDLKTIAVMGGKNFEKACHDAFHYNKYFLQAATYFQILELIRNSDKNLLDVIDGDKTAHDLIDAIRARKEPLECYYIFAQKGGVPMFASMPVPIALPSTDKKERDYDITEYMTFAFDEIDTAQYNYFHLDRTNMGEVWRPLDRHVEMPLNMDMITHYLTRTDKVDMNR